MEVISVSWDVYHLFFVGNHEKNWESTLKCITEEFSSCQFFVREVYSAYFVSFLELNMFASTGNL